MDRIISPEAESAERLAKSLDMKGVVDSFELSEEYNIIEATVPEPYVGKSIAEANFRTEFNVNVLTILRMRERKNLFGKDYKKACRSGGCLG
ncbi:hypothetical protein ACFSRY_05135 [Pontibacter locisalis]|uniref:Uncharacterized protein n=1 Tax=Pontibacter locisalis TaxID=1719035 RepID=A0ABW5IIQ0_9BACT